MVLNDMSYDVTSFGIQNLYSFSISSIIIKLNGINCHVNFHIKFNVIFDTQFKICSIILWKNKFLPITNAFESSDCIIFYYYTAFKYSNI